MSTSISFPQMRKLHDTLVEKGVTSQILQDRLIGDGIISDVAEAGVSGTIGNRDDLRKALGLAPLVLNIIVDYSMTFDRMVSSGGYDVVDKGITQKHFPMSGKGIGKYECKLFHFNCNISSGKAEEMIRKEDRGNQWVPATIEHLLAFGAAFPELQRTFPIVGLGCIRRLFAFSRAAILWGSSAMRGIECQWRESESWDVTFAFRFLAVRRLP